MNRVVNSPQDHRQHTSSSNRWRRIFQFYSIICIVLPFLAIFNVVIIRNPGRRRQQQQQRQVHADHVATKPFNLSLVISAKIHQNNTLERNSPVVDEFENMSMWEVISSPFLYTQFDIARFVKQSKHWCPWWHLLVFDPKERQFPYQLFNLHTQPVVSKKCQWCHDCHWCQKDLIALLIDGISTGHEQQQQHALSKNNRTTPTQLLITRLQDYILMPCMKQQNETIHGVNSHYYNCSNNHDKQPHPPFITVASIPKMPIHPHFMYQFPVGGYSKCLQQWRKRQGHAVAFIQESSHNNTTTNNNNNHKNNNNNTNESSATLPQDCQLRQVISEFPTFTDSVWEKLVPQVYWTGTNFAFLPSMPEYRKLEWCYKILPNKRGNRTLVQIANLLLKQRHRLIPRCHALAMSLLAEAEWSLFKTNQTTTTTIFHDTRHYNMTPNNSSLSYSSSYSSVPWLNVRYMYHEAWLHDLPKRGYGFFFRKYDSPQQMSKYKYQIDLGGYSGTTWLGTLTKLAMPGLLFHHETPYQDWFYRDIQPWIHYVPIHVNLSNLYDMYVWAESHPHQAKQIAKHGQDYARHILSDEYFSKIFHRLFVEQVATIINAYRPSPPNSTTMTAAEEETIESIVQEYKRLGLHATLVAMCNVTQCQRRG